MRSATRSDFGQGGAFPLTPWRPQSQDRGMKNPLYKISAALLFSMAVLLGLVACSENSSMVSATRDAEFFEQFYNEPADYLAAKEKLAQLKVLETGEDYPMRFVLFQDGRFYYQIDRLGDGNGFWRFEQGGIELTAVRPIFDMHIYLSARAEQGNETLVRFYDRHGFNSVNTHFVAPGPVTAVKADEDPARILPGGVAPAQMGPAVLRPYTYSDKGI